MGTGHDIRLVRRAVPAALDGLVAGVVGLSERAPGTVRRRQPAGSLLPLVLSFGNSLRVESLGDGSGGGGSFGSFVAGFSTGPAVTSFEAAQDCVQVYLTPIGVRRILGVPGREVARRVVAAEDVVADLGESLSDRLHCAATWDDRFALVEALLLRQAEREPAPAPWVSWMWGEIQRTGGQARIASLVAATGWSHRHVASTFGEQVGLTPKQAAGVVRFERAAAELGRRPSAEVAFRHGYADQSHLARDVARRAGETPGQLVAARRPTPWTALGHSRPLGVTNR